MVIIKSLKRKFGISAPRVAVRPHFPWYLRWLVIAVVAALALALGLSWGIYDAGRKFANFDMNGVTQELDRLSKSNMRLQQDNEALRIGAIGLERRAQMELAVRDDLVKQVKILGNENTQLKEDLAFLQTFMSGSGMAGDGVSIYHFKLGRGQSPGEYRYSLLLVQGGQRTKDFQGSLEFTVNLRQNGGKVAMLLPGEGSSKTFNVSFKFYQRVEKNFRLQPDAVVESLQVRVFENGVAQAKLTQVANLPS
ncbi:MAG: hypothetical protein Q7S69_02325 [Nitrosomonadaceae bacterium]|nr:hypothetical protein [Nitrosomonadaceae bacterium]